MDSPSSAIARPCDLNLQKRDEARLHGRAFYESLGSPKVIMAPMVDQSEFAWRMLSRSFLPENERNSLLCYSPMLHSRLFASDTKYRNHHFRPTHSPLGDPKNSSDGTPTLHLDGNPEYDRPLFVQFCSNTPEDLLAAARLAAPYCDAVDLNLGCPQGIARRGHYGAFLQEDWDTIYSLINTLHKELSVPVTAKMRVLDTKERTLEYAQMILRAGASILTVHGRVRDQKGHRTGLADWSKIRYLRENLPPETVLFANGNILQRDDIQECLDATGADGIMSAEGNLSDPTIFAEPPQASDRNAEYWTGRDGKGGWRMDAVLRRYLNIIHKYILEQDPPARPSLFVPTNSSSDKTPDMSPAEDSVTITKTTSDQNAQKRNSEAPEADIQPSAKKQKRSGKSRANVHHNLSTIQAHLFTMLRPLVSRHTNIRDALARSRAAEGDISAFENVLHMVEEAVAQGLRDYEDEAEEFQEYDKNSALRERSAVEDPNVSSKAAVARCKRPWFICQSHVRPLPIEALQKGAITLSVKEKEALKAQCEDENARKEELMVGDEKDKQMEKDRIEESRTFESTGGNAVEVPKEGVVCG